MQVVDVSNEGNRSRWRGVLITIGGVLAVLAICVVVYGRAENYGRKVVEAHPVAAKIAFANPPAWLHEDIIGQLRKEAYDFAQRDENNYNRCRDVLNDGVLREIADLYVGTDAVDGKSVSHQGTGYNAWIREITAVRRNVTKDQSSQTIEIVAQWRKPAAWVRANAGGGEMLYLVDTDGVRLPGDYPLADRAKSRLMVITGVDLPVADGHGAVPAAGQLWAAKGGAIADDLAAGMKLAEALKGQNYVQQIDAIDMSNFSGRKDLRAAWIVLDTVWQAAGGGPRTIYWGRPIGGEWLVEVKSDVKLSRLNEMYGKMGRIDAGRDYVDIRTENVWMAKAADGLGR